MFKELVGDTAILSENGVYRQAQLYEWDGYLFAKFGGGFVKLNKTGGTSKASGRLVLVHLNFERPLYQDPHGRLMTGQSNDRVSVLPRPDVLRLTGPATEKTDGQ